MTSKNPDKPLAFPPGFLFGAATSAHQVEGGNHNQWTVWELENAKSLAKQAEYKLTWLPDWQGVKDQATDPSNYVSGQACDHFNRYREDFDLLRRMNMNAFRFSVEWSRIEPREGVWDAAAFVHYKKYVGQLRSLNIEPVVTLMHWTLPVWFAEKGGFARRGNVKYFVRFAKKVFMELGGDIKYFCTLNEPEVYTSKGYYWGEWPPNRQSRLQAMWVYLNLASAHNRTVRAGRRLGGAWLFGLSKDCAHNYPGDDAWLSRLSAALANWALDYFFLNMVRRKLDWLGLNYYFSNRFFGYRIHNPEHPQNDLGWTMEPRNLQFVIERLSRKYRRPIMVTESGVADRGDRYRKWWISASLAAIARAIAGGARVDGYLHWSLLDNFEWAFGKWPRFGLAEVNYRTLSRRLRPSALWYGQTIKKLRR
ncbi:MAG: glycoside hydrolase family 1 protein [Candidatus Chaera renei]|uniref:Glycoside hydrolase family 1 protein n=1 Tax=Candidatus Chaera renei TaxID=2506947 RepID=A0A4Q0AKD3_9BACT|nr:MAG: glycoside hydrolase family 1 protein [Candidatus Chaera renei]